LPNKTLLAANVAAPVPPTATVKGPEIIVLVTVPVSPVVINVPLTAGMVIVDVVAVLAPVNVTEPPLVAWNTKLDIKSPEF
jgi:hypothetical protein